ncbi:polysaccharide deacetylase family protein [Pseudoduganella sp. FT55W]|uniref:Polysaccharide deacetylase family protein n=1 Tax=Duganella rivi TaxID=2666083 RepID=A0A7X4KBS9_9BURK|nr:polysaccharide deacetylase family protein [Duganella rivi]MYM67267.1 polysaccharide deacetylase family protein [Duganella rivi]
MNRLSILIYHRVLPRPDPLLPSLPDARRFDRHMAILQRCFNVLPMAAALRGLQQQCLPPRAAIITFDDGYADNATCALPILQQHGLHATFFIASGYLDGGQMWNDDVIAHARRGGMPPQALDQLLLQLKYLPFEVRLRAARALAPPRNGDLMMTTAQVQALAAAGMTIGAHTHRHPILAAVPDDEALADIRQGKAVLEALIQAPVTTFAYPNGRPGADYRQRHVEMVREAGFEAAFSTVPGVAYAGSDVHQLPRFTPWEPDRLRFLVRLLLQRRVAR